MIPGEYKLSDEKVPYNVGYEAISLEVKNVGDRAVQVGSHYHFYEANEEGLRFDRKKAFGKRLEKRTVNLIDFGGKRRIFGFNNRVNGYLDESTEE